MARQVEAGVLCDDTLPFVKIMGVMPSNGTSREQSQIKKKSGIKGLKSSSSLS